MANDINPALRAELVAADATLDPQLRGLHDLLGTSITEELRLSVGHEIDWRSERDNLILATIAAIDAAQTAYDLLIANGYPDLPNATLPAEQFTELTEQSQDLATAIGLFGAPVPAARITANLGTLEPKHTLSATEPRSAAMADITTAQWYPSVTIEIFDNQTPPQPAQVQGPVVWATSDATVLSFENAADGLSGSISTVAAGSARITFSADADLGAGVTTITGETEMINVTTDPNLQASTFTVTLGAPAAKVAPPTP